LSQKLGEPQPKTGVVAPDFDFRFGWGVRSMHWGCENTFL